MMKKKIRSVKLVERATLQSLFGVRDGDGWNVTSAKGNSTTNAYQNHIWTCTV